MKVVIQRVSKADVTIDNKQVASIHDGFLVLLGIINEDSQEDINWLSKKIINLRVFGDENGVMNKSLVDVDGDVILVSQFTLHANTRKGNRPSFIKAARPETAIPLYEAFIQQVEEATGTPCARGEFGADMQIALVNDGPVTIIVDSKLRE